MARFTAIGIRNQGVGLQKAEQLGKAATWWFGTHPAGATPHQVGLQLQGFIPAEFPPAPCQQGRQEKMTALPVAGR